MDFVDLVGLVGLVGLVDLVDFVNIVDLVTDIMKRYKQFLLDNEQKASNLFVSMVKSCLGENMIEMKIFGSKVRGDANRESDIDILLVVKKRDNHTRNEICRITSDININFDCMLSPLIYTEDEYNRNKQFKTLFAKNIAEQGVIL